MKRPKETETCVCGRQFVRGPTLCPICWRYCDLGREFLEAYIARGFKDERSGYHNKD